MKIVKVYNNNVVQALDSQGREIIVMGKGLGFQKKVDQCLDQDKIEKTFVLQGDTAETDLFHLYSQMPAEDDRCIETPSIVSKGLRESKGGRRTILDFVSNIVNR